MLRKIFLFALIVFLLGIGWTTFFESTSKKKFVDWSYHLRSYSKDPHGTSVFFKEIDMLFPNQTVTRLNSINFESNFYQNYEWDSLSYKAIIEYAAEFKNDTAFNSGFDFNLITVGSYFGAGEFAVNSLLTHVIEGGNVQLHAYNFSELLSNALAFSTKSKQITDDENPIKSIDTLYYADRTFLEVRKTPFQNYIDSFPEEAEIILKNKFDDVLGIKYHLGKGTISIYTVPQIFTNYDMLYFDHGVAENIVTQLPLKDTFWSSNLYFSPEGSRSLLGFIYSNSSLKWAYLLLLFSVLLYLSLLIQRKLRVVPIITPPKNLSLSFLHTISDLHFAKKDYKGILQKKISYLLSSIKLKYHLSQTTINEHYLEQLSKRSKIDQANINQLFKTYDELMKAEYITEKEFESLCKLFQLFKN